ncbi:hypothetical protein ACFQZQ_14530 [Lysobacter koreensis]|uniref:STAS/SEC14 domain-containing protein n=1 Tax=Lysobacter koreensis TaxID=266122 RepID=A0ABW2YQU2_9GAMM
MHEEAKYFEVRYAGAVSVAERAQVLEQLAVAAERAGFRRCLMDLRDAQFVPDAFAASNQFASRVARETVDRDARVAYVAKNTSQIDPTVENLTSARGVPFRRFNHRLPALAWLLARQP